MIKLNAKPSVTKSAPSSLVKEIEPVKETKITVNIPLLIIALAIVFAGGFTGYVLANAGDGALSLSGDKSQSITSDAPKMVGVKDEKTFKDSAEGILREEGVDGEGTHHIERPGGPSQNVYITSSNIALDDYTDKKVKVWGETFAAEKAGWLMDVGRLEVLD